MKHELVTKEDFYNELERLCDEQSDSRITLESFLTALLVQASKKKQQERLSWDEIYELLEVSFTHEVPRIRDGSAIENDCDGFAGWESTIRRQISDLQEMGEKGILDNEYRYFGLKSPSLESWYNFDPFTFIECAAAGSLDWWRRDKSNDTEINGLSWNEFKRFLYCGQMYE